MTAKTLIEQVDNFLAPLGFERKGPLWNRKAGSIVEVIDVQISKAGDTATINAGVLHPDVYKACWDKEPLGFIEEPFCTVRARVGELIGEYDLWWPLGDSQTPHTVIDTLTTHVLPFLKKMQTPAAMEEFLSTPSMLKQRPPLPKIYLAILKHRRGDTATACAVLDEVRQKALGEWQTRATEVAERLGCN
jgi:hypothetical protein